MQGQKEEIICIFNEKKHKPNKQIGKAFEIYLKEKIEEKSKFGENKNIR